ncbi:RNA helicase [Lysinibacillus tabacifolii]|uniref:RNA helicase n=1 Tax=Lysinibacillus tabacifolii TaxID=1173107 RepID=A0ABY2SUD3_9BACI|nr:RNA helicase [Lysinibacillus tabacifolii]TKI44842.1 RNA helicase [Lysinibacillus tabacifolii]
MSGTNLIDISNENVTTNEVQTLKVGLIMPISNTEGYPLGHWAEVRKIIEEALLDIDDYKCKVSMVSEAEDVTLIQKNIIQRIYEDDIVIVDVSSKNPNVMFELGVRFAFDKAFILLKDDDTDYSFDISSIHHINYPKDLRYKDIVEVKEQLKTKLIATFKKSKNEESMYLKDFGTYQVSNLESTELPYKEYMEKMFTDIKKDIRNIKLSENQVKNRGYLLENRVLNLVQEYIELNPNVDTTKFYKKDHEIQSIIRNDKEVSKLVGSLKELDKVIDDVYTNLSILPF